MFKQDQIQIEILEDGRLKWSTSGVSAQNHTSADVFLKTVATMMGGKETRERNPDRQHHHHHATGMKEVSRG